MIDISHIYEKKYFEAHYPWKSEYVTIADILVKNLQFSSVIDLGFGSGFILSRLMELGKRIFGVEGSRYALEAAPENIKRHIFQHDLTVPFFIEKFDLVICTEVAEHIPDLFADVLVDNICAHSNCLIFFSAATPGQGGHHHINEQPHFYWIEKFSQRNYELQKDLIYTLRNELAQVINIVR